MYLTRPNSVTIFFTLNQLEPLIQFVTDKTDLKPDIGMLLKNGLRIAKTERRIEPLTQALETAESAQCCLPHLIRQIRELHDVLLKAMSDDNEIEHLAARAEPQRLISRTLGYACPACRKVIAQTGQTDAPAVNNIKFCWNCGQAVML